MNDTLEREQNRFKGFMRKLNNEENKNDKNSIQTEINPEVKESQTQTETNQDENVIKTKDEVDDMSQIESNVKDQEIHPEQENKKSLKVSIFKSINEEQTNPGHTEQEISKLSVVLKKNDQEIENDEKKAEEKDKQKEPKDDEKDESISFQKPQQQKQENKPDEKPKDKLLTDPHPTFYDFRLEFVSKKVIAYTLLAFLMV